MARVLVACEYSGRVRDAFLRDGHDALSCDLLPTESPGPHYQGNVLDILGDGWDLMIAHPECTYLTAAAEWAYGPGPYHQKVKPGTLTGAARIEARAAAVDFVKKLWAAPIARIAIENPVGVLSRHIGKPQIVQPYQFGDDASKATGLHLKNLPPLKPTKFIEPRLVCCGGPLPPGVGKYGCTCCLGANEPRPRWANQTDSGQNRLSPGPDRWKERSRTFLGIADAMGKQWGRLLDQPPPDRIKCDLFGNPA